MFFPYVWHVHAFIPMNVNECPKPNVTPTIDISRMLFDDVYGGKIDISGREGKQPGKEGEKIRNILGLIGICFI